MLMPLRVQWLVQPSVYTRRPCHIRSTHIACVYRPELENKQTSQWLDHSPCRCASPSPFAAVRREIEHQSLARQHSLAHGAPAVLPQSFSLGRQFLPRRRPIPDTPASLRPAPCPMPPAPRIPAGSERITGLPKGHNDCGFVADSIADRLICYGFGTTTDDHAELLAASLSQTNELLVAARQSDKPFLRCACHLLTLFAAGRK